MTTEHHERNAEELVRGCSRASSSSRLPLSMTRGGNSIVSTDHNPLSRDFVYSLHHNFKSSLLYGKNNVAVADGDQTPIKGYLSLHKSYDGVLTLRWTPNHLMHASSQPSSATGKDYEQQWLWKQAINVNMEDIIYIHLHQRDESSPSSLTLVNCDGVQCPPLQLSAGGHSLVFLTTLETGLAPNYRLDPPLWTGHGKEKSLPRLRKRTTVMGGSGAMLDYVFRIVRIGEATYEPEYPQHTAHTTTSPKKAESKSLPNSPYVNTGNAVDNVITLQIDRACQTMRQQILARAFFGWLSYCRHLRTVRNHLMYLVNMREIVGEEETMPVDDEFWKRCRTEKTPELEEEFLLRVYWKGIEGINTKQLRRQAWPYLLNVFRWDEDAEPKIEEFTKKYREDVENWKVLESEVRRKDEEELLAAKQRKISIPGRDCSIMSDVFEEEWIENELEKEPIKDEELLLRQFGANVHRIEKDVERCDRNLIFYSNRENLESLRRVMVTYVRRNLDDGYIQGMCDILAPLLVVFEDEPLALECFTMLMTRLRDNFPHRTGMDICLMNFRSLIQVVDPQVFTLLTSTSDATHLYFSYRWFLLDFKRELSYDSIFRVWETIWAAGRTFTPHFPLFFGLAMVTNYREVIVANKMDFTDMIKFFNEMAERHDCSRLLTAARTHVRRLQNLVQQVR